MDSTAITAKLVRDLISQKVFSDRFYMTGFECICINANHAKLSESVISSVVPLDGELLIIGNDESCALWRSLCHKLDILVSSVDGDEEYIRSALEAILNTNNRISHIICGSQYSNGLLQYIGTMAHRFRCTFIVDNCNNVVTMSDIKSCNIDFLVTADEASDNPTSMVIARRSKLVQAEGNARSNTTDIYAQWQQMVEVRQSTLEPMA